MGTCLCAENIKTNKPCMNDQKNDLVDILSTLKFDCDLLPINEEMHYFRPKNINALINELQKLGCVKKEHQEFFDCLYLMKLDSNIWFYFSY